MGKEVHVLIKAVTLLARATVTKIVVFVLRFVWLIDWYLEWAVPSLLIDPLVCVSWICVDP